VLVILLAVLPADILLLAIINPKEDVATGCACSGGVGAGDLFFALDGVIRSLSNIATEMPIRRLPAQHVMYITMSTVKYPSYKQE
jgi:hypothetical protein